MGKIILGIIGVIVILGLVVGGYMLFFNNRCASENENITVGTLKDDGKCCNGLVAQSPEGFTGGAWCIKPYCDVVCLTGDEETQGVTTEGIYSICHSQTENSVTLLKQTSCPRF